MNFTNRRQFLVVTSALMSATAATTRANPMNTPALLDINLSPAVPWVNGKGLRRELLQHDLVPGSKDGGYGWRVGVAYVTADAPFSALPGIDRWITLVDGDGFTMKSPNNQANHVLSKPLAPHFFPGEAPVDATLLGGRTEVFNVLAKRGVFAASVVKLEPGSIEASASTMLIYCTQGTLALFSYGNPPTELAKGQAAVWHRGSPALHVNTTQPGGSGLIVRIWPTAV